LGGFDEFFHNNIGIGKDPGGEKKSLDIIPPIKLTGKLHQFLHGKGGSPDIRRGPVYAVGAVKTTAIGIQDLEEADTAAIFGPTMAYPGGYVKAELGVPPGTPGGRAGGVVFCRPRQEGDFFSQIHNVTIHLYSNDNKPFFE
jgi:hypothetical protein